MTNLFKEPYEMMSFEDFEDMLPDMPATEKWELLGGRVVRNMVGARWEHSDIITNIEVAIHNHIRAKAMPCRTFRESFWLKKKPNELAAFPDVMVHCGRLEPGITSVDDPMVLVEVVSKGSAQRDRFEKRKLYQRLPSLREYVLVALDVPDVEVFRRTGDLSWENETVTGLDGTLALPSIGLDLPLAEIYRGVIDV